jgi:hypothetical protein
MCGHADHVEWKCPELVAPIRQEGMMKPPAGQPSGGDDDDCIRQQEKAVKEQLYKQEHAPLCAISTLPIQLLPVY